MHQRSSAGELPTSSFDPQSYLLYRPSYSPATTGTASHGDSSAAATPTEATPLVVVGNPVEPVDRNADDEKMICQPNDDDAVDAGCQIRPKLAMGWVSTFLLLCALAAMVTTPPSPSFYVLPADFVLGVATSSYQIEGAVYADGRGWTIWDAFAHTPGKIVDNTTGDVADDHYHRMRKDVKLMSNLHISAYRFSIAWSRILPNGTGTVVNQPGIDFYNALIDCLLQHNITPYVTLFHWDLPQTLQDEYGGWQHRRSIADFVAYAHVCFANFGDRVQHWITLNEAWTVAVNGYATGVHAPGHHSPTAPYVVGHHLLLAHAQTVALYRRLGHDNGMIGIANCGDFRYPATKHAADREAAHRAMLFQFGWFTEPLFRGDYPDVMRARLGNRLPVFTPDEQALLINSTDFIGLNYYSAKNVAAPSHNATYDGYWAHMDVNFTADDPQWRHNAMGWAVVPDGLREMLSWISARYNYPTLYITENGSAEADDLHGLAAAQHDVHRRDFFEDHLRACAQAINVNVDVRGYFAWSFMDNFEWQFGYTKRFGMVHVDYGTLVRTPKLSADWYRKVITTRRVHRRSNSTQAERTCAQGATFDAVTGRSCEPSNGERRSLWSLDETMGNASGEVGIVERRTLPAKVLLGYGSNVDKVREAVHNGVNVVAWAFVDIRAVEGPDTITRLSQTDTRIVTRLNLTDVERLIKELRSDGHDVVHLMSVGGWNSGRMDDRLSSMAWYLSFHRNLGRIFDGIDWDIEGNNQIDSPANYFDKACLKKMLDISEFAKSDGYFITMAPPQSYLDVSSASFSRYVNLTDPTRAWHNDFHYFGRNIYAFVLYEIGPLVDLISVQFYESYSRASEAVHHGNLSASEYLIDYVTQLVQHGQQYFVDFASDASLHTPSANVSVPLSKLLFGFANGWAHGVIDTDKVFFAAAAEIEAAWQRLLPMHHAPRGLMFWTIDEEGTNDVALTKDLRAILDETSPSLQ